MALTKVSRSLLDTGISDSSDATAITIDSSENVGIANTSPVSKLDVTHTITANTGDSIASFGTSGSGGWANSAHQVVVGGPSLSTYTGLIIFSDSTSGNGQLSFADGKGASDSWRGSVSYNHANDFMKFDTNANEVMRFTSAGNVFVNQTVTADSGVADGRLEITRASQHCLNCHVAGTGNSTLVAFINDNGFVGGINTNGSATVYNTSSDARLKNVLGEAKGLEVVNALNPVNFEWKSDGKIQDGLIAQEVEKVFPDAVSEPELKGEWYSVDYSKLVTPLIKGMQEQQKQIEALQSEINTLKGG